MEGRGKMVVGGAVRRGGDGDEILFLNLVLLWFSFGSRSPLISDRARRAHGDSKRGCGRGCSRRRWRSDDRHWEDGALTGSR